MSKSNRTSFLPAIGQAIMNGMRAETLAAVRKGDSLPSYCIEQLYKLANIPMDFEQRWSYERAIQDVMIKAREYGFVDKGCGGRWYYEGPEVETEKKKYDKKLSDHKKKVKKFLEKKGLKTEGKISVSRWHTERGKTTVSVVLPKELWFK